MRVIPAGVPVPRGPPSYAGPEVRRQPPAQARLQRRQRGAEGDEGRGGTAPAEGERRGRDDGGWEGWMSSLWSLVDDRVVVVVVDVDAFAILL